MTARLPRPGRMALLLGAGALACALLALLPGEGGPQAARAGLAVLGLATVAALLRRGGGPAGPALRISARAALGRCALAIVEVDGRRFLVGAGERAVELLAELEPSREGTP